MTGIPRLLLRLWRHLSRRRKRQLILVVGLIVLSAVAEVVSLGAILPFLAVLTAPERVFKYRFAADFMHSWGVVSPNDLILPLAMAFAATAVIAGALRMGVLWVSTRVAYATGSDLSISVYRRTLYQPYQSHLMRNSGDVISGITGKVGDTVYALNLMLLLLSSALLLVFITAALLAIDPIVASLAIIVFGSAYALTTTMTRRRLRRNSERIDHAHTQLVKALQEGLGGIRDVLLDGTQPVYCDIYSRADRAVRQAYGNTIYVSGSPRYVMEALGLVLISAFAYVISRESGGVAAALPGLGALALGAQRLLPVLQQGYSSWAGIVGSQMSISRTLELLDQPMPSEALLPAPPPLPFRDRARFNGVRFKYTIDGPWVLDDFNLTIRKGSRVGLVGSTGSGKSTTLDLLMGLLLPTAGEVLVDGEPLVGARIRAWQRSIAHVPQAIYLSDASLAENIAFGVPRDAIDMESVKQAARHAQIADFIESRSGGYSALVGERGVRLSGGQRQRIGIARALYKKASVLIFDEATSALDGATEQSVMEAIEGLNRDFTIVLIAHRIPTVRNCDVIVELEHGRVIAQGTYDDLIESSPTFRSMVRTVA